MVGWQVWLGYGVGYAQKYLQVTRANHYRLPRGQSVMKFQNVPKVLKFCPKKARKWCHVQKFPLVTASFRFVRVPKIRQCVTDHTGCRINYVATVLLKNTQSPSKVKGQSRSAAKTNQPPINGPHVLLITVGSQGTIGAISSLRPPLRPSRFIPCLGFQQRIRLGFDNKYGVLFENHSRFLIHSHLHRMRLMTQINMSKW
jgi:hypothetical protein